MKPSYKTLSAAEDEIVIRKSRFKSFIYNIKGEGEAQEILGALREKYSDATHICYAYIMSVGVNIERFSDDGEPSGTAGMPILEVLKNSGYSEILAVVVRYFGGVKLGAGGLIRAYAESVKNCILKAEVAEFRFSGIYNISLDFSQGKKINQLLSNIVCKTLEISYTYSGVSMRIAVPVEIDFERLVTDFLSGKASPQRVDTDYIRY